MTVASHGPAILLVDLNLFIDRIVISTPAAVIDLIIARKRQSLAQQGFVIVIY
jgi:hypothetical protein